MRHFLKRLTVYASAAAAVSAPSFAQDRKEIDPQMKVLLENECVRVQYHDVAVGKSIPMHSHPGYVVYTLKPFKARITLPDGTQRVSDREAGVAYWNEPITHSVENIGDGDILNLIVELKPGSTCKGDK